MAIAFDAKTDASTTSATSITFAHTCTGSNRVLYVTATTNEQTTSDVINGATYNSVAMTLVGKKADALGYFVYLFVLPSPASGANNVVVSASTTTNFSCTAVSYTGGSQVNPTNSTTSSATSATVTMSITTLTNNAWIVAGASRHRGWTAGANTVLRTTEGLYAHSMADSNGNAGGSGTPGAKSLVATQSDTTATSWVIAEIEEPGAAPAGGARDARALSLLGVG